MGFTAAANKGALVIVVCVVLLHSSMEQQLDPKLVVDCGTYCDSNCTQRCNVLADAEYGKCNTELEFYEICSKNCTSYCNGNSFSRSSCTMGSCSASDCGYPCARSCCKSCTDTAPDLFYRCSTSRGTVFGNCMFPCMYDCNPKCLGIAPPPRP